MNMRSMRISLIIPLLETWSGTNLAEVIEFDVEWMMEGCLMVESLEAVL